MTASKLITAIERAGGRFEISGGQVSLAWPVTMTEKQRETFARLAAALGRDSYCVTATLLEREASRQWERSGRNPAWWRESGQ